MTKKLFITGISGFIGRHVAKEAVNRGYEVSGMDLKELFLEKTKIYKGDITDKERVAQIFSEVKPDYVIHLAAITANTEFRKMLEGSYRVNVNGFINVIEAAVKNGCKRFVYASSSAVYLEGSDYSETTKLDIDKQKNHYAKTKMINEMIANSYEDIYKMKTIGLRFFNTYGPTGEEKGDTANIVNMFMKAKRDGKPLVIYGDGKQARDMIYIDDAVNIALGILENGTESVYNVGSGTAVSFKRIAELVDKNHIQYIPNPLPTNQYQYYTQANTKRTLSLFKNYKFTPIEEGVKRSDFIRVAVLSIAREIPGFRNDFSEYAENLAKNLQSTVTGRVDLIHALGKLKQNDAASLIYLNTLFKRKVKELAGKDYDVIHITNQEMGFAARILKTAKIRAKVVVTVHDVVRLEKNYHHGAMQRMYDKVVKSNIEDALQYSDFVVFNSEQTQKELAAKANLAKPWKVIPLGIPDKIALYPSQKKEGNGKFNVGYLDALVQHKNPIFVLKTAKHAGDGFHFMIYGEGPEHSSLAKYKSENNLGNVTFKKFDGSEEIVGIYDSFDSMIVPSQSEGFGVQIIEAQARGIPVIICKGSKIPEEVRKNCIEASDEVDAARILNGLKANGVNAKERNKRISYAKGFTWSETAKKTVDLYRSIVG